MQSILTDVVSAGTEAPLGYGLGYSIFLLLLRFQCSSGYGAIHQAAFWGRYRTHGRNYRGWQLPSAYVVLRKDTPADMLARRLASFMLSENGQRCVRNAGYGALQ